MTIFAVGNGTSIHVDDPFLEDIVDDISEELPHKHAQQVSTPATREFVPDWLADLSGEWISERGRIHRRRIGEAAGTVKVLEEVPENIVGRLGMRTPEWKKKGAVKDFFSPIALESMFRPPTVQARPSSAPNAPFASSTLNKAMQPQGFAEVFGSTSPIGKVGSDHVLQDEGVTNPLMTVSSKGQTMSDMPSEVKITHFVPSERDENSPSAASVKQRTVRFDPNNEHYDFTFSPPKPQIARPATPEGRAPNAEPKNSPLKLFQGNFDTFTEERLSAMVEKLGSAAGSSNGGSVSEHEPKRLRTRSVNNSPQKPQERVRSMSTKDFLAQAEEVMGYIRRGYQPESLDSLHEVEDAEVRMAKIQKDRKVSATLTSAFSDWSSAPADSRSLRTIQVAAIKEELEKSRPSSAGSSARGEEGMYYDSIKEQWSRSPIHLRAPPPADVLPLRDLPQQQPRISSAESIHVITPADASHMLADRVGEMTLDRRQMKWIKPMEDDDEDPFRDIESLVSERDVSPDRERKEVLPMDSVIEEDAPVDEGLATEEKLETREVQGVIVTPHEVKVLEVVEEQEVMEVEQTVAPEAKVVEEESAEVTVFVPASRPDESSELRQQWSPIRSPPIRNEQMSFLSPARANNHVTEWSPIREHPQPNDEHTASWDKSNLERLSFATPHYLDRIRNNRVEHSFQSPVPPTPPSSKGSIARSTYAKPAPKPKLAANPLLARMSHLKLDEGNSSLMSLSAVDCSFSVAAEMVLKALTDVEPFKPDWTSIRKINLSCRELESLMTLEKQCPKVKELDVSDNQLGYLTGIPTEVRALKASRNRLTGLTTFSYLKDLQYLDVADNEIDTLHGFATLYHMRELNVNQNEISSLDGVTHLDGLLKLNVRNNGLKEVHFTKGQFARLEELDLSGNEMTSLTGLKHLQRLMSLRLDGNLIKELKVESHMRSLRTLRISGNDLETFDASMFPNLRTLYLDDNCLSNVHGLRGLKYLENLSIRDQRSEGLKIEMRDIADVRKLYLSGNKLAQFSFDKAFYNLQYLEVAAAGLTALPNNFTKVAPNLRVLNISYNAIRDISALHDLQKLNRLFAVGNELERAGDVCNTLLNLRHLQVLDLRGNPLTQGFYAPVTMTSTSIDHRQLYTLAMSKSAQEEWQTRDATFRKHLPADLQLKRKAYEGLVYTSAPGLKWLCGGTVTSRDIADADKVLSCLETEARA
ncbi:Protein nud1 [Saitoella coloradoensis]